jgi:hypothetical protein
MHMHAGEVAGAGVFLSVILHGSQGACSNVKTLLPEQEQEVEVVPSEASGELLASSPSKMRQSHEDMLASLSYPSPPSSDGAPLVASP